MWSLNNLANKAAEALNSAKKGISDISKDPPPEIPQEKKQGISINMLKQQCLTYKTEVERQKEEILAYKRIIHELNEEKKRCIFENKPIDFKIIIGKEQTDEEKNEIDSKNTKINELTIELDKVKKDFSIVKQLSSENIENFKQEIDLQSDKNIDLTKKNKILEEQCQSLQDSFLKSKSRMQKIVIECYDMLKASFNTTGLNIPQIKAENLGQEDIQEFIYTQSKYIEDSMKALNNITMNYNKKFNSLEELKQVLSEVLNDSSLKIKEALENTQNSDAIRMRTIKEKEELHKILVKKEERIKLLNDETKKLEEEMKNFEEIKADNIKLVQKVKILTETKENSDKIIDELKNKIKKTSDHFIHVEETNTNLNKRLKSVNSNILDKENTIKILKEEISAIKTQNEDIQSYLDEFKATSEKNLKEINDLYTKKLAENQENSDNKINDLKSKLSKALNDAKDAGIANIRASKYQKAVEELQDVIKNLESQSSNHIKKIERLSSQHEASQILLKKRKEKLKMLKTEVGGLKNDLNSMQNEYQLERKALIAKAQESEMVRFEAESLLKRIETQIQASDSMIDKRLISTFLINYLNEKNGSKIKIQMLRALAEMLGLDQEQRVKIGLVQDQGLLSQFTNYIMRS